MKIEDRKDAENFAEALTVNGFEAKLNFVRELHDIPEAGEEGVNLRAQDALNMHYYYEQ